MTNTYVKPTDVGLATKFDSAIAFRYKINLISCLVERAYRLNSTLSNFRNHLTYLISYFCKNNYPQKLVLETIKRKVDTLKNPSLPVHTATKEKIYLKVPFLSTMTNRKFSSSLRLLLSEFYPQINCNLVFFNRNSIGNLFKFKDNVPSSVRSNVVYKYSCGECSAVYVGETVRHLRTRIAEHRGISPRTGNLLQNHPNSNIYRHYAETGHIITPSNFSILSSVESHLLKLLESIKIRKISPNLNDQTSSVPLNII